MEGLSHLGTICSPPSSSSSLCTPYASSYNFHTCKPHFSFNYFPLQNPKKQKKQQQQQEGFFLGVSLCSPRSCLLSIKEKEKEKENEKAKEVVLMNIPKLDKSGRFCSPRAARELALMIVYASCLEGSDPVRLFEKRINARREIGYQFDKESLLEYNHMTFGGPPVMTESREEADELLHCNEKESAIEAEVLSAPPKLVYSKLLLRFARKLLLAVVEKWDSNVLVIDKVAPVVWKNEPAGRILELCILHLAMSEITVLGTRHQIVINEAVDLAKRFCDGAAPRIINGCLRTFMKDFSEAATPQNLPSRC